VCVRSGATYFILSKYNAPSSSHSLLYPFLSRSLSFSLLLLLLSLYSCPTSTTSAPEPVAAPSLLHCWCYYC